MNSRHADSTEGATRPLQVIMAGSSSIMQDSKLCCWPCRCCCHCWLPTTTASYMLAPARTAAAVGAPSCCFQVTSSRCPFLRLSVVSEQGCPWPGQCDDGCQSHWLQQYHAGQLIVGHHLLLYFRKLLPLQLLMALLVQLWQAAAAAAAASLQEVQWWQQDVLLAAVLPAAAPAAAFAGTTHLLTPQA